MKWLMAMAVAWLAFDAFVVQPRHASTPTKSAQVASASDRWPQLSARKEPARSHHGYSSLSRARGGTAR
jgi:hypothetical protein